jgi:hypothetical protein
MARFRDRAAAQRMNVDTSPPIRELWSARRRGDVYTSKHLLSQQLRFALTRNVNRGFPL